MLLLQSLVYTLALAAHALRAPSPLARGPALRTPSAWQRVPAWQRVVPAWRRVPALRRAATPAGQDDAAAPPSNTVPLAPPPPVDNAIPPFRLAPLVAGVPFYAALNVALLRTVLTLGPRVAPAAVVRWSAFIFVAFFTSWASSVADGAEMLLAAARGQVLMPNMVPNMAWFDALRMPSWTPPGIVFPIAWLLVSKPTQVAACLRLTSCCSGVAWGPISLWAVHLCLGDAWNSVFFTQQRVGWGVAVISVFYGALLSTAYAFSRVDRVAGLLMLPTCCWVTVAASLNWSIWLLNRKGAAK
mmetsp:Transcript_6639/g.20921  ORF Transcript_6639/g.20921 Transcript_6639/m.20921 type:complete len:300 (-) Transcript_6639:22-921(-)